MSIRSPAVSSSAWRGAPILKPKVLLFDEPLSNLDANLRRSMRDKIRELQNSLISPAVRDPRSERSLLRFPIPCWWMNKGHIMQIGSPQDLYRQPASRFMASFMGDANLFPSRLQRGFCRYLWLSAAETAAFCRPGRRRRRRTSGAITLGAIGGGGEPSGCTIRHVGPYMGPQHEVTVEWHGQEILLQVNATRFAAGCRRAVLPRNPPVSGCFVLADAA